MNRIPLKSETTIKYIDKEYIVDSVIGSGATCIVYSAHYIDKVGMTHNIRLKECYPYNAAATRVNNEIIWESESEKKQVLSSFIVGYEKLMKNQMGNYSVNAFDLVIANGTYYILMDSNEGTTFDKEKCVTIYDVLYTIKLLAYVVGEYHKNGYLHLDIKPENFLVYPRPSEHIILFDMDSITAIEDIRKGKVKSVSYSMKWAAPEQTQRKLSKICPATDIFSIGAVLFYKIMGRNVSNEDIGVFSEWDFEQPLFEKVNPKLKLHISKIFKKTLAVNINRRYQNTDELIADIDEAMECARYNSPYVMSNFPSAKSVFVGRDSELSQLRQIMNDNRVVFLSGIGGIGKTSLVLEYLRKSKREFGTILFLRYDSNIDKTLKTSDIVFRNYEDAGEEGSNIINGLSELMDENDLIILDNFDNIDNLNELNEFIDNSGIQCKIIITTRIHSSVLSDVGFCSMHIKELAQTDVEKLFYIHNGINYNDDEKRVLRGIFNNFEFHTLCVELIAKYLRIKAVKPSEFRDRIYNSLQGISGFDDVKIVEKKDNRIERRSMQKHLEVLFDITELEAKQKEIMFSLSLLGSIRISKKLFLEWLSFEDKEELLEELIECGWVECNNSNKITLHQLICDMIYTTMQKSKCNVDDLFSGLKQYLDRYSVLNIAQQDIIGNVCFNIAKRSEVISISDKMVMFVFAYYKYVEEFYLPDNLELIDYCEQYISDMKNDVDIDESVELYVLKSKAYMNIVGCKPDDEETIDLASKIIDCCERIKYIVGSSVEKQFEAIDKISVMLKSKNFIDDNYECNAYLLQWSKENTDGILKSDLQNEMKARACIQVLSINSNLSYLSEALYVYNEENCLRVYDIEKYRQMIIQYSDTIDSKTINEIIGYNQIIRRLEQDEDYRQLAELLENGRSYGVITSEYDMLYYYKALQFVKTSEHSDATAYFQKAISSGLSVEYINKIVDESKKSDYFIHIYNMIKNKLKMLSDASDNSLSIYALDICANLIGCVNINEQEFIKSYVLGTVNDFYQLSKEPDVFQIQKLFDGLTSCYVNSKDKDYYELAVEFLNKNNMKPNGLLSYNSCAFLVEYASELILKKSYVRSSEVFRSAISGLHGHENQLEYLERYLNIVKEAENIEEQVIMLRYFLDAYNSIEWDCTFYVKGKYNFTVPDINDAGVLSADRIFAFANDVLERSNFSKVDPLHIEYIYSFLSDLCWKCDGKYQDFYGKQCDYALIAEDRCSKLGDLNDIASEWSNAALNYSIVGNYKKSFECYQKARECYHNAKEKDMYSIHDVTENCLLVLREFSDEKTIEKEVDIYISELEEILTIIHCNTEYKDLVYNSKAEAIPAYCVSTDLAEKKMYLSAEKINVIRGVTLICNDCLHIKDITVEELQSMLITRMRDLEKIKQSGFVDEFLSWCREYIEYCEDYNAGNQEIKELCVSILSDLVNTDFEIK